MEYYSSYITKLVEQLGSLPGIGRKTAQRLAFHIMNMPVDRAQALADSIIDARNHIRYCSQCFTLTDEELCPICRNEKRNQKVIMVVENSRDLSAYEKTGKFEGVYSPYKPQFSAIVTCFFMDVVSDVRVTIARLYSLLVNGGIWSNVGPIVNHNPNVGFFAPLTFEDIDIMAKKAKFEIIEQRRIETSYSQNPLSHVMNRYNVAFTVYRK